LNESLNEFEVIVTTDIVKGGRNLGDTHSFYIKGDNSLKEYLNTLFSGMNTSFVSGMAVSVMPSITVTASVYQDNNQLDLQNILS